jgi:hypothetical protein
MNRRSSLVRRRLIVVGFMVGTGFHGWQAMADVGGEAASVAAAIRLTPVGDGNMFGRAGILAHPYMLGPNGQSNGCVSFSDYPSFLDAFLNGEIDRLVVVEHLDSPPDPKTASGWLADRIKAFFIRS